MKHKKICNKKYIILNHIERIKIAPKSNNFFTKRDSEKILNYMQSDKKNRSNQISLVLLKKIGNPVIN